MMSVTAERPPSFGTTDMDEVQSTNVAESIVTVLAAIELSKTTWLLAIHDPTTNKVSRRRSDGGDVEGIDWRRAALSTQPCRLMRAVQVAIECVFEAGYDGFWLHRRLSSSRD